MGMNEEELKKIFEKITEVYAERTVRTLIGNDEKVITLLESFHEAGATWDIIFNALTIWGNKRKGK